MESGSVRSFRSGVALVVLSALMVGMNHSRAEDSNPAQVVIIASPKKVKLLASATEWLSDEELRVANEYAVELDHVTKIAGDGDVPKRLSLKMFAIHAVNISGEKLITIVLGIEEGRFHVKYWDVIRQTTCIPRELYRNERLPDGFNVQIVDDTICFKFR